MHTISDSNAPFKRKTIKDFWVDPAYLERDFVVKQLSEKDMNRRMIITATSAGLLLLVAGCEDSDSATRGDTVSPAPVDGVPARVSAQVSGMFAAMDTNQDGAIDYDELQAGGMTYQDSQTGESLQGDAAARAWLERFDTNGDGRITQEEMLAELQRLLAEEGN